MRTGKEIDQTSQAVSNVSHKPRYRILVGTTDIAGQLADFASGFRQLGHQATSVVSTKHSFFTNHQYDVALDSDPIRWADGMMKAKSTPLRLVQNGLSRSARLARLFKLIVQHDVFVFLWAGDSLRWGTEVPLLKKLGKRIVWVFCGDDVRHSSSYEQEFDSMVLSADHRERLSQDPLTRPLQGLRLAERHSDLIISLPNQSGLAVRPYNHFFVPLNLSQTKVQVPSRDMPVVLHAPSLKSVKGTELILAVVERLKGEGVAFELQLLHGVSNQQVLSEMAEADVVIDQLHFPLHGKFAVEAMASGCAVATCNREDYESLPPNRPIWHVDPENLYGQLRRLLTDRDLRVRLAREGRAYVERYHDHVQVARRILDALSAGTEQPYDHYPSFFARAYQLPDGVVIPENLKRLTAQIVQRWGLPEGADPQDMIRRGLMSADGLIPSQPIPRWTAASRPTKTEAA